MTYLSGWTIKATLKKYHKIEIELLLAHLLRKPREFLFMFPQYKLTRIQHNRLTRMVQRRLRGEPVAYILGYKDFYGLRFKVNKNVLIPRPETEMVVDCVVNVAQAHGLPSRNIKQAEGLRYKGMTLKILDLGTGSGNIIISLAKILSTKHLALSTYFYASDISRVALKVARQNAQYHTLPYDTKIKFIQSDLLEKINFNPDIIIANLPYGWNGWKNNTSVEAKGLKFEPKQALFTKENGLMVIRKLLEQIAGLKQKSRLVYPAPLLSKKWCWIYLEFDPRQKSQLSSLIKKSLPGSKTKFYKDYNNFWRYAEITPN